jgi:hypothetical protein
VIETRVGSAPDFLVVGAVRGLLPEAVALGPALDRFAPQAVALGLSADELAQIEQHFGPVPVEPLVPLAPTEVAEIRALTRYGEVRVPNPVFLAALAWGRTHGRSVGAVDPSDDTFATMFTDHIGYPELVRRTLRERRLTRHPPAPATADEFALAWGGSMAERGGSARLARARDVAAAAGVRRLAAGASRVAVVVDRERARGMAEALGQPILASG